MRELIQFLVENLVDDPDSVEVRESEGPESISFDILLGRDDAGKVIGKQGRIIGAVRTVAKAAATRSGKRVYVEVVS
ncbi:MAG TPA: KH domain-containing protein [Armatimonadota bacterium]|jgi:hypothetical protein